MWQQSSAAGSYGAGIVARQHAACISYYGVSRVLNEFGHGTGRPRIQVGS